MYDRIADKDHLIRRMNISCNKLTGENRQITFADILKDGRDEQMQKTMADIKGRFGKNAIFRARDLQEGATALERGRQIGGHKSGE